MQVIDINVEIHKGRKKIGLAPGKYLLKSTVIIIGKNNVEIFGTTGRAEDVEVCFEDGMDGIVVKNSNFFVLRDLTLTLKDTRTRPYQGVALIMEESNYSIITGCVINATNRGYGFGVFLAGPKVWSDQDMYDINKDGFENEQDKLAIIAKNTLTLYRSNKLMRYNVFKNNVFNCVSEHDGFSFSLQYGSEVSNNVFNGTRVALYMLKKCAFNNNVVNNSVVEGVYVSTPSRQLKIENNKIINPLKTGILIDDQLEHDTSVINDNINNNYNIDVQGNEIVIKNIENIGIKLIGTRHVTVAKNLLYNPNGIGVLLRGTVESYDEYGNRTYNPSCSNNKIIGNDINIKFDNQSVLTTNVQIKQCGVFLTEYSTENLVSQNRIFYGISNGAKKIGFYELTARYIIVDGVKQIDPNNPYPANNFDNYISRNQIYVPNTLPKTVNDCIDMTSSSADDNIFELNEVKTLNSLVNWSV